MKKKDKAATKIKLCNETDDGGVGGGNGVKRLIHIQSN